MQFEGVDWRLVMYLAWGGGTVIAGGKMVSDAVGQYYHFHDRRSRRELVEAGALFMCAIASLFGLSTLIFYPERGDIRGLVWAIAAGSFLAALIYMATDRGRRR